jgi:RHS repeat-associated protein
MAAGVRADSLSFEAEATSVVLPEGPSSIGGVIGSFDGGGYRGDVRLALPLPLPDGAGGPVPDVALRYSSEAGQGPAGLGWSVPMPRICRSTRDGVVPVGDVETIALEMFDGPADGELVVVDGEWQPRNDAVSVRVRRLGEGWQALTPDGGTHDYGTRLESRTGVDPSAAASSSCWYLDRSVDPRGRRLEYVWRAVAGTDGASIQPERVRWAFGASGSFRELVYTWSGRDDAHTTHLYGHRQSWTELLRQMEVRHVDAGGSAQSLYTTRLTYGQGVRGARLVSVAFEGADGTALPEHRFEWGSEELRMRSPEPTGASWELESGRQSLMDVDGDGRPDLLEFERGGWRWRPNTGGSDVFGSSVAVEGLGEVDPAAGWRVADLNADGLRDVVSFARDEIRWFANESADGAASFASGRATGMSISDGFGPATTRFGDINGDGALDAVTESGGRVVMALGVAGPGVPGAPRFGAARYPTQGSGVSGLERVSLQELQLADMDGDGVDDLVRLSGVAGAWGLTVYHGSSTAVFAEGSEVELPAALVAKSAPSQVRLLDVNGDGRPDVIFTAGSTVEVWLNDGGERIAGSALMLDPERVSASGAPMLADLNGDNRLDVLIAMEGGALMAAYAEPTSDAGLLIAHDNGMGARRELQWAVTDARVSGAIVRQRAVLVEQRFQVVGSPAIVTRMSYEQAAWDPARGRFAGFGRVRTTLVGEKETGTPEQRLVQDFYLGVGRELLGVRGAAGLSDELSEMTDVDGLAGRVRAQVTLGEGDAVLKEVRFGYEVQRLSDLQHRVVLRHEVARQPEGLVTWLDGSDGPPAREADWGERVRWIHTETDWSSTGQRIREHRRGYVQDNGVELAGDEQCQEWDWSRHPDRPWYLPIEQRRLDGSCTSIQERSAQYYDGDAFVGLQRGTFERGEVTRTARYLAQEDRWIDESRVRRGERGEILERQDAGGHRVVMGWDAEHAAYVEREELWLTEGEWGQANAPVRTLVYEAQWEPTWGRMTQHRNPAQQTTRMEYDRLGRRVRQIHASGTSAQTVSETSYEFDATGGRIVETGYGSDASRVIHQEVRRMDGAGRALGTATMLDDTRSVVRGVVSYSMTGAVLQSWNTYVTDSAAFAAGERPAAGVPLVTHRYDELGRQIEQRLADGHVKRRRYLSGITEHSDSSDVSGELMWAQTPEVDFHDGLGQMVRQRQVMRDESGAQQLNDIAMTWDALGRRTTMVRQHGQQRRWSYDSLGRLSAYSDGAESLEWAYDDTGRMLARSNSAGDVVMWSYDAAGRVTGVDQMLQGENDPTAFARYEYDRSPDGGTWAMGRLWVSEESGVRTELQYGFRGEVWRRARVVDGRRYEVSYQYDELLRPTLARYPGGVDVQTEWDLAGRPTAIPGYVDAVNYDDRSLPVAYELANGTTVERAWDEQRRRIAYGLLGPDGRLMDTSRTFGANQQPDSVQDRMNPEGDWSLALDVTTDGRGRVLEVDSPAYGSVSYELDAADRLLARVQGQGSAPFHSPLQMMDLVYSGEFADAAVAADGRQWVHDSAGRVVEHLHPDSRRTLTWDAMDHVTRIEDARGWISEYRWSSAVERLTAEVRDTEGQLLERRTRLDQHSEEIVNERGAWLRVMVELHGEPVARRELLRATGDWSNLAANPLPREPWRASIPLSGTGNSLPSGVDADTSSDETAPWSPRLGVAVVWMSWALLRTARRWGRAFAWPRVRLLTGARASLAPRAAFGGALAIVSLTGLPMLLSCGEPVGDRTTPDQGAGRVPDLEVRADEDHRFWMHSPWLGTVVMQTDEDGAVVGRSVVTPDGVLVRREFTANTPWYERFGNADREEWTGYVFFGARFYDPDGARWLSRDPLAVTATLNVGHSNAYAYVGQQFMGLLDVMGLGPSSDPGVYATVGIIAHDLLEKNAGGSFGSVGSGVAAGVAAGVGKTLMMLEAGYSGVDSVTAGSAVGGFYGIVGVVAASNPVVTGVAIVDTGLAVIDPNLSFSDPVASGITMMSLSFSALSGDSQALQRYSDETVNSTNYFTGPLARFGDQEVSEVLHEAELEVRNMVYDVGQSYERAVDAGADVIEESVSLMQSLFGW